MLRTHLKVWQLLKLELHGFVFFSLCGIVTWNVDFLVWCTFTKE